MISHGFPKRLSVCSRVCVTRKVKIRHSKLGGPKGLSRRQKDRGPNCILSDSAEPETVPGSNYGFPICILCESRKRHQGPIMDLLYAYCTRAGKRHQGPIMDFLCAYCARAGKGTRVQLWIFCMHIVRESEKAPGSIYGFSICILCESH